MNEDGSNVQQITEWSGEVLANPRWHPAGTTLVATTTRLSLAADHRAMFLFDADGSNARPVQTVNWTSQEAGLPGEWPNWHPDGTRLLYSTPKGVPRGDNPDVTFNLETLDLRNNKRTAPTDDPTAELTPTWGPDGSQIVFGDGRYRWNAGEMVSLTLTELYLSNGSGETRQLLLEMPVLTPPIWHPSGNRLAITSRDTLNSDSSNPIVRLEVFLVDVPGGSVTNVDDDLAEDRQLRALAWSPDGSQLLIRSAVGDTSEVKLHLLNPESGSTNGLDLDMELNVTAADWLAPNQ